MLVYDLLFRVGVGLLNSDLEFNITFFSLDYLCFFLHLDLPYAFLSQVVLVPLLTIRYSWVPLVKSCLHLHLLYTISRFSFFEWCPYLGHILFWDSLFLGGTYTSMNCLEPLDYHLW